MLLSISIGPANQPQNSRAQIPPTLPEQYAHCARHSRHSTGSKCFDETARGGSHVTYQLPVCSKWPCKRSAWGFHSRPGLPSWRSS